MVSAEQEGLEEQKTTRNAAADLPCQRCAAKIMVEKVNWEEDGEGFICRDCAAENDSCGCSD